MSLSLFTYTEDNYIKQFENKTRKKDIFLYPTSLHAWYEEDIKCYQVELLHQHQEMGNLAELDKDFMKNGNITIKII